ncbi:hypothetical protein AAFF24_003582 [Enterobacter bugandensis]
MSVKRYEWVACDEHSCHCDVVESTEGDMVDYEDYAALEARCAALAAENAGLKAANGIALKILNDEETMVTSLWASSVQEVEVKTPATDAFLAEVRASAIKSALNDCTECLDRDCIMDLLGISYEDAALREAGAMALHDALLRKGVQS